MQKLNPRLAAVAGWVPPGSRVADVGTDHGYLPLWLIQTGRAAGVIACDISRGPLDNARRNLEAAGLAGVQLRLGDGLDPVEPEEADCITIAGMGGDLTARIVEKALWLREPSRLLLLQPMSAAEELRAYLYTAGFVIERERAVPDHGRLYVVMAVRFKGSPPPLPQDTDGLSLPLRVGAPAFLGKLDGQEGPDARLYIEKLVRRLEKWAADIRHIPRKQAEYRRLRQIIPGLRAALRKEKPDDDSGTNL
ncbi:MAG: SAM-dependent methyltransferase [Clostridiales bacterium]|nr:SAM-dependent methyltransferase [Clostridiales bacterium]